MAGTYPLAEGLSDRFMAAISLGRANADEEVDVLTGRRGRTRLAEATAVSSLTEIAAARSLVDRTHVHDTVARYAVDILNTLRDNPRVQLGPSTRAGVGLIALAKAFAVMSNRDFVTPHDIARAATSALAHRLVAAGADRPAATQLVAECLSAVPAPRR